MKMIGECPMPPQLAAVQNAECRFIERANSQQAIKDTIMETIKRREGNL